MELVQAAQRLGVVAVGGHHQRAALAKAGRQAAALLELGRECGPALARRAGSPAARPPRRSPPRSRARASPPPRPRRRRPARGRDRPRARTGRAGWRARRKRGRSGRRRSRRRRSVYFAAVQSLPSPALPGSGSTVGGAAAALSARFPRASRCYPPIVPVASRERPDLLALYGQTATTAVCRVRTTTVPSALSVCRPHLLHHHATTTASYNSAWAAGPVPHSRDGAGERQPARRLPGRHRAARVG